MTDVRKGLLAWAVIFLAGGVVGWSLGKHYYKPIATTASTSYAPAIQQKDGSLVLERNPTRPATPKQTLPPGARVERVVEVQVQPDTGAKPVSVDLTLVKMPDNTERVVASSPDGKVIGGVDVPAPTQAAPRTLKWAAGGVWGTTAWGDEAKGIFVDRDFEVLRTGVEVTRNTYALANRQAWEVRCKIGIRW